MLQTCSIFKIAGLFFKEPTKGHYLLEISAKTNLAHTSVKKHLMDLKKRAIVTELLEKKGKRYFPIYTANMENREYKIYKRAHNLLSLEESGVIDVLKDEFMPACIVVFGSYARGEDVEDSDIDIFLECKEGKIGMEQFEKQLSRKIQLHFKENFGEYPKELRNNISNGIVLRGYLKVV